MTSEELHWLAGLLEGEGCFGIKKTSPAKLRHDGGRLCRPNIQLVSTDKDIIEKAALLMETSCTGPYWAKKNRSNPNVKGFYRCGLQGDRAVALMKKIKPLMGERRTAKIDEVLALDRTVVYDDNPFIQS